MKRISTTTKAVDKFGAGKHGFTAGDPVGGVPATALEPDWFDHVQEEICNVLAAGGVAVNPAAYNQLSTAIAAIVAAGVAGVAKPGADIPFLAGFKSDFTGDDVAVQTYGRVIAARNLVILGDQGALGVAATGADLVVDITKNGVSVYTTKPKFTAAGTVYTAGVLDNTKINVAAGDVLDFKVTQRGSTIRGQQVAFTLKAREA